MIYLDHAATSPMSREVIEAMWPYLTAEFANASSQHELGKRAAAALQDARSRVASVMHCEPGEITFTSGGTESDNLAVIGLALARPHGRHIVTTAVEHEAVLETCSFLEHHFGFTVTVLDVDRDGLVDLDVLGGALSSDTTLCAVQYANNEVGTVQPVAEIAARCRTSRVPLHVDAVQAAGLLPLDVDSSLLAISGHKFGGPKGIGVLRVENGIVLEPLIHGGGQERGLRSGTSNVAGAVGLATALEIAESRRANESKRLAALRDRLIDAVLTSVPDVLLTGHRVERLPSHASFSFPGVSGEAVLLELEADGIACSSGSACAAGSDEPSYVLTAMNIGPEVATTAVRFTLGSTTTEDDIDVVLKRLPSAVARARQM